METLESKITTAPLLKSNEAGPQRQGPTTSETNLRFDTNPKELSTVPVLSSVITSLTRFARAV